METIERRDALPFIELEREINKLDNNIFQIKNKDLNNLLNRNIIKEENKKEEYLTRYKFNIKILEKEINENNIDNFENELLIPNKVKYITTQTERKKSVRKRKNTAKKDEKQNINLSDIDNDEEEDSEIDLINEIDNEENKKEIDEKEEEKEEEDNLDHIDNSIKDENFDILGEDKLPIDDEPIYEPLETKLEVSDIECDEEDQELEDLEVNKGTNDKKQIFETNESSSDNNLHFTQHILAQVKSPIDMLTIGEKIYELFNKKKDKSNEKIDLSPLNTYKKNTEINVDLFRNIGMGAQYNQFLQSGSAKLDDYITNDEKEEVPTVIVGDIRDYKTNCSIWIGTNKGKLIRIPICQKPSKDCQGIVVDTEECGISAMDVFENYLIMGHFDGTIQIWEDQKVIEKIKDIKCEIIKIKFIKINIKKKKYEFIVSDANGNVSYMKRIKNYIIYMSRNQNEQIVSNKEFPVYKINIFSKEKDLKNIKKKNILIALATLQNVSLYKIRPKSDNQLIAIVEIPYCSIGDFVFDCDFGYGFGPISQLTVKNDTDKDKGKENNFSLIDENLIKEGQEEKILLVVSFGKVIRLFEITMNSDNSVDIKEIGHFINDFPVYKIGFITKSYLTLIDSKKNIKIINTFCFEDMEYKEFHSETKNNYIIYDKIDLSDFDILKQNNIFFNNAQDGKRCFALSNFLGSSIIFEQNIFIVTKQKFLFYKLSRWDEVINALCQNEEYKKMLWLCTFLLGKNKKLSSIESEDIDNKVYESSLQESLYIFLIKCTREENNYKELRIFIEYCLKTGRFSDFYKAKETLAQRKLDNYLYEYTTQYIVNEIFGQILFEVDFLKDFINYYINRNEIILLSKILLKLSVKNLNRPEILNILKKNNIINPYIYAIIWDEDNSKNDYFKPIENLFDLFVNKIKEEKSEEKNVSQNENNEDEKQKENNKESISKKIEDNEKEKIKKEYINLITEHDMKYYYDKTLSCCDYLGHKLLWYIYICLLNENIFDGHYMPDDIFSITCKKISLFLTSNKVMEVLLKFDSFSYFILITRIFKEGKSIFKCSENQNYPYEGLEKFIEQYFGNISAEYLNEKHLYYKIKFFIENNTQTFKNNIYIKYDFYKITSLICENKKNNIFIDRGTIIDGIKFLLNYKSSLEGDKIKNYYDPFACHKIPDQKDLLYKEFSESLENSISNLLESLKNNQDLYSNDLDEIFSLEGLKNNNKISQDLYEYGRKYVELYEIKYNECIDKGQEICLENKINNFFEWIYDTLKLTKHLDENGKKKYYETFRQFIKSKFADLCNISIEYSAEILYKYFNDEKDEIIFSFEQGISDSLYYCYMNNYLNDNQIRQTEGDIENIERFLLKKIGLLKKYNHKEQIINLLKKNNTLCNKNLLQDLINNKVDDAAIYICLKIGEVEKCIEFTLKVLDKIFSDIIHSIINYNEKVKSDLIFIKLEENKRYLDLGLEACPYIPPKSKYSDRDIKSVKDTWIKLLDEFYNHKNELETENENNILKIKYKSNNFNFIYDKIEQNISENIEYILSKMNDNIPLSHICDILSDKFKQKKFKEYSKMFIRMFLSSRRIEGIYQIVHKILFDSLAKDNNIYLDETKRGVFSNLKECYNCKNPVCENYDISNLKYFKCGHFYHNLCCAIEGGQYVCYICRKKEEENSTYTEKFNFVFRKKEIVDKSDKTENSIKGEEEQKQDVKKNKMLGKLKKFARKKNEKIENFKVNIQNIQINI